MADDTNQDPHVHGLDELGKKLYQPGEGNFAVRRSELTPVYPKANQGWAEETLAKKNSQKPPVSLWVKVLFWSFVFFVLALTTAYFIFTSGTNVVSDKNIDITVQGPVTMKAGQELDLATSLTNKNVTAIEEVELTLVYPAGTRDVNDPSKEVSYLTQKIGTIRSGETVNLSSKVLIFGKENDEPEVGLIVRYHLAGSNTLFEKDSTYRYKITASPIDLNVVVPPEINSNQEFGLDISIGANSDKALSNVLIEASYPPGFQFKSSDIPPSVGSNKWLLGDLAPGITRVIHIRGVIEGENEQLKSFEIKAGTGKEKTAQSISVLYNDIFKTLTVKKSFLGISISQDGVLSTQFAQKSNESTDYLISWINNLPVVTEDVRIVAKITGEALDKSSVSGTGGFYSSSANTITWNKHNSSALAKADPGAGGNLNLSFKSESLVSDGQSLKNPQVVIDLSIVGTRVSEGFANEVVETNLRRVINIDSQISLIAKTLYRDGPFVNSGPVPPKVDTPTTYTISWSVTNSSNDLADSLVVGTLPLGVSWVGMTSPAKETVSYDETTRRVTWNLGPVKAGTGIDLPVRTAYFQVSLIPSLPDIDLLVSLVRGISLRGTDTWSGSSLVASPNDLTTSLSLDSAGGAGQVVK